MTAAPGLAPADEELDSLGEAVAGVLARSSSSQQVRALLSAGEAVDPVLWKTMGDLGWTALLVPESFGGAGAGLAAAVVVLRGLGAHFTPSPYLSSAVLATVALARGQSAPAAAWLPRLAAGDAVGTVALTGMSGRIDATAADLDISVDGDGYRADGAAGYVLDGDRAAVIVALGRDRRTGEPIILAIPGDAPGLCRESVPDVDLTRQLGHLRLDGVSVPRDALVARGAEAAALVDVLIDVSAVALAADAVGAARRALDLSVEYAKQRVQFGRVIGSFQAIKHKLADMFVLVQAADAGVVGAAAAIDADAAGARRRAAAAGSFCRQAASRVVGDAVQTHGGIGFTWEHDCHLLLKRAKFDEVFLTDVWTHRGRLLDALRHAPGRVPAHGAASDEN